MTRLLPCILFFLGFACSKPVPQKKTAPPPGPKIIHFYASPGAIARGERATMCYGVENAASVVLHPPVERVYPAFNRCFTVEPASTTTYTFSAKSSSGVTVSENLTITVGAAKAQAAEPTLIQFFTASSTRLSPGQGVTICFGVKGAKSVRIQPQVKALEPAERSCFNLTLDATTRFTLLAIDDTGAQDRQTLDIEVR